MNTTYTVLPSGNSISIQDSTSGAKPILLQDRPEVREIEAKNHVKFQIQATPSNRQNYSIGLDASSWTQESGGFGRIRAMTQLVEQFLAWGVPMESPGGQVLNVVTAGPKSQQTGERPARLNLYINFDRLTQRDAQTNSMETRLADATVAFLAAGTLEEFEVLETKFSKNAAVFVGVLENRTKALSAVAPVTTEPPATEVAEAEIENPI